MATRSSTASKATPKKSAAVPAKKKVVRRATTKRKTVTKKLPLSAADIKKLLHTGGFRGGICFDEDVLRSYSTDESIFSIKPQVVIQPKDGKDIELAVKLLSEKSKTSVPLSLTARAAGTGLGGGSLTDSIIVDVRAHMHHIGRPERGRTGVTITVEPGAMWRDVESVLKKEGVYLPSFPASKDICSIGGAVANNAAGPDSLRFGHTASWVASLDVVLHDGESYTITPLNYGEYKARSQVKDTYGKILRDVFSLLEKNEALIKKSEPKTSKNTAGYALWDMLDTSVADFKKGRGMLDMTRLISGSQGTIGIITSITLKTSPIKTDTSLIAVPIFKLEDAGHVIQGALRYKPINIELFDGFTFDLALKNPQFFHDRLGAFAYLGMLFSMYKTYLLRWGGRLPEFVLLVTLDPKTLGPDSTASVLASLRLHRGEHAKLVRGRSEKEMLWQVRRASYTLSKLQDPKKRPAAFLEDIAVPPERLAEFFAAIKALLRKYNLTAAVHGHGGNGHLHFYPLIDFTKDDTPDLVTQIAEEFFTTAVKLGGNLCGEHNDGIIRTPHLNKMFDAETIAVFEKLEKIFDPKDIFNPGKKVNPRFDIKSSVRKTN